MSSSEPEHPTGGCRADCVLRAFGRPRLVSQLGPGVGMVLKAVSFRLRSG